MLLACTLLVCIIGMTAHYSKVLLLMLDGLRWDLFGLDLPELKKVEEAGVKAEWMDGVFITTTIPSTFSMATGKSRIRVYVILFTFLLNVLNSYPKINQILSQLIFYFGSPCL